MLFFITNLRSVVGFELVPFVLMTCFSEGISKVKTPAVKAFKATYQGRYTLRDCESDALSMSAMETVTDLLLEIMEVGPLLTRTSIAHNAATHPGLLCDVGT